MPEDSPWVRVLEEAARARGMTVDTADEPNDVAPVLSLPRSYQTYLAALPPKMRHEIRRKARRLEAEAGRWDVRLAGKDTLEESLDGFVELHLTSDGPKGAFLRPGMEIFFRRLGEAFLPGGVFTLTFIELERRRRIAGTIGFGFEGIFYLYNSAFDRAYESVSPGMVLVGENVRMAIERGCSMFDLLRGDHAYKYRFGAVRRAMRRLVVKRRR